MSVSHLNVILFYECDFKVAITQLWPAIQEQCV